MDKCEYYEYICGILGRWFAVGCVMAGGGVASGLSTYVQLAEYVENAIAQEATTMFSSWYIHYNEARAWCTRRVLDAHEWWPYTDTV